MSEPMDTAALRGGQESRATSRTGEVIPAEKPCTCDVRTTAVEVLGVYDGALYFECVQCRAVWHRWPRDDWRHDKAEAHLAHRMQPSPARLPGDAQGGV